LQAVSLPENQYKYDDEQNGAKGNIHNVLSLLMMAHPSPFTHYQALSVPCEIKRFSHAWCPAVARIARCLVQFADQSLLAQGWQGAPALTQRVGVVLPESRARCWAEQLLQVHAVSTCEAAALSACFSIFMKTCQNDGSNNAQGKRGQ
jgi:hypothetical protein